MTTEELDELIEIEERREKIAKMRVLPKEQFIILVIFFEMFGGILYKTLNKSQLTQIRGVGICFREFQSLKIFQNVR